MSNSTKFLYIVGFLVVVLVIYMVAQTISNRSGTPSECEQKSDWAKKLADKKEKIERDFTWRQEAYLNYPSLPKEQALRAEAQKTLADEMGCNPN